MGQHFDGIYTGFVASEAQIDQIFHFIEYILYIKIHFLLVDPVMGDDGIKVRYVYTEVTGKNECAGRGSCDIITPNLTELCLLTDAELRCNHRYCRYSIFSSMSLVN